MLPQQDLVKSVSKNLKYYFDVKRREDGFDLSGPYVPRPDHPPLKSRPTLMYDGLHDKPVKHYFTQSDARRVITHMKPPDSFTMDKARKIKRQLRRHMNKYSFKSKMPINVDHINRKMPWVGTSANDPKGITNSSKYVTDPFQMLRESPHETPKFTKPFRGGRPLLRAAPPHNISRGEAVRLVNAASRSLFALINGHNSADLEDEDYEGSGRGWMENKIDAASNALLVNPMRHRPATASEKSLQERGAGCSRAPRYDFMPQSSAAREQQDQFGKNSTGLSKRPKSAHAVLQLRFASNASSDWSPEPHGDRQWVDHSDDSCGEEHENVSTLHQPTPPMAPRDTSSSNPGRSDQESPGSSRSSTTSSSSTSSSESGSSVSIRDDGETQVPPEQSTDGAVAGRQPKPTRPKSAKRTDRDRYSDERSHSRVTLSEAGSYEEVPLDDTDPEDDDVVPVAMQKKKSDEKGVQTGWELFSTFDPSESMVLEGKRAHYRIRTRTGKVNGASATAPVHVTLFGSHGHSPDILLEHSSTYKKPLQKGQEDMFSVETLHVGELKRIRIGHNREDTGQWFLDSVAVEDLTKGWVYEFPCNKWLSLKSDDKMTRRDLSYSSTRVLEASQEEPHASLTSAEPARSTSAERAARPAAEGGAEREVKPQRQSRDGASSGRVSPSLSMGYSHMSTAGSRDNDDAAAAGTLRHASPTTPPGNDAGTEHERGEEQRSLSRNAHRRIQPHPPGNHKEKQAKGGAANTFFDILLKSNQEETRASNSYSSEDDDLAYMDFFDKNTVRPRRLSVPHTGGDREVSDADEAASETGSQGRSTVVFENISVASKQNGEEQGYILGSKASTSHATNGSATVSARKGEAENSMAESLLITSGPTIHGASRVGNLARIKELVYHSADLKSSVDDVGDTPLHVACKYGHADIVRWLAEDAKVDGRARNRAGYEAVHEAALHGHIGCLRTLLTSTAASDVNVRSDDDRTPLHLAASAGHYQTCCFLVANGASLSAQDSLGRTAAELADEFNHHSVHDYLVACQRDASGLATGEDGSNYQAAITKGFVHADEPGLPRVDSSTQWRDDVKENFPEEEDDEVTVGSSVADLRHKVEHEHELEERKKLYEEMQEKKKSGMTFLDMIRQEAGGESDDNDANND